MTTEELRRAFEGLYPERGYWYWEHPDNPWWRYHADGGAVFATEEWHSFKSAHALGVKAERERCIWLASRVRKGAACEWYEACSDIEAGIRNGIEKGESCE